MFLDFFSLIFYVQLVFDGYIADKLDRGRGGCDVTAGPILSLFCMMSPTMQKNNLTPEGHWEPFFKGHQCKTDQKQG